MASDLRESAGGCPHSSVARGAVDADWACACGHLMPHPTPTWNESLKMPLMLHSTSTRGRPAGCSSSKGISSNLQEEAVWCVRARVCVCARARGHVRTGRQHMALQPEEWDRMAQSTPLPVLPDSPRHPAGALPYWARPHQRQHDAHALALALDGVQAPEVDRNGLGVSAAVGLPPARPPSTCTHPCMHACARAGVGFAGRGGGGGWRMHQHGAAPTDTRGRGLAPPRPPGLLARASLSTCRSTPACTCAHACACKGTQ